MLLIDRSQKGIATLILAHGAGAPMDSDFMNQLTAALNRHGVDVVRFEFPYMQQRRQTGSKRPPDRQPVLLGCWQSVYQQVREQADLTGPLLIGGKSMGGRMASLVAGDLDAAGVCCFGYPFHPPGKPEQLRTEPLRQPALPVLIVQGTRDPFGKPDELAAMGLGDAVSVQWLEAGDHDFKPTVKSGLEHRQHIDSAARWSADFARRLAG